MSSDPKSLHACLAIFDLEPGATIKSVKASHRTLVKVWHPDRFEHDPKLRIQAEGKLKEINAAYQWLNDHHQLLIADHPATRSTNASTPPRPHTAPSWMKPEPEHVDSGVCKYCGRLLSAEKLSKSGGASCCRDQDDCLHFQNHRQSSPAEPPASERDDIRFDHCRYCGRDSRQAAFKRSGDSFACTDSDSCLAYQDANINPTTSNSARGELLIDACAELRDLAEEFLSCGRGAAEMGKTMRGESKLRPLTALRMFVGRNPNWTVSDGELKLEDRQVGRFSNDDELNPIFLKMAQAVVERDYSELNSHDRQAVYACAMAAWDTAVDRISR